MTFSRGLRISVGHRRSAEAKARRRERERTQRALVWEIMAVAREGGTYRGFPRPPEDVIAERDHAIAAPRSLSAIAFGDPLPGRSALDRRGEG